MSTIQKPVLTARFAAVKTVKEGAKPAMDAKDKHPNDAPPEHAASLNSVVSERTEEQAAKSQFLENQTELSKSTDLILGDGAKPSDPEVTTKEHNIIKKVPDDAPIELQEPRDKMVKGQTEGSDQAEVRVRKLQKRIKGLNEIINAITTANRGLADKYNDRGEQIETLQKELQTVQEESLTLQKELATLKQQHNKEMESLRQDNKRLEREKQLEVASSRFLRQIMVARDASQARPSTTGSQPDHRAGPSVGTYDRRNASGQFSRETSSASTSAPLSQSNQRDHESVAPPTRGGTIDRYPRDTNGTQSPAIWSQDGREASQSVYIESRHDTGSLRSQGSDFRRNQSRSPSEKPTDKDKKIKYYP